MLKGVISGRIKKMRVSIVDKDTKYNKQTVSIKAEETSAYTSRGIQKSFFSLVLSSAT
jgi:hypothetical protein